MWWLAAYLVVAALSWGYVVVIEGIRFDWREWWLAALWPLLFVAILVECIEEFRDRHIV
jgi:hypothetical protein